MPKSNKITTLSQIQHFYIELYRSVYNSNTEWCTQHMNNTHNNISPQPDLRSFKMYLFLWSGQLVSFLGSSVVQFTIIWWITVTTQSAWYLALSSFLGIGSTIMVQPFSGVLADKFNRKWIIAIVDMLQALATVVLMALFFLNLGTINAVLSLLFVRGLFQGFQAPALNAIIPSMVPQDKLSRVNSLRFLLIGVINFIGPIVGALLIALIGIENLQYFLVIDAVTFLVSLIPLAIVTIPEVVTNGSDKIPFRKEVSAGFDYIRKTPGLLSLLLSFAIVNFFLPPTFALLPLMVSSPSIFGGDEIMLATALGAFQIAIVVVSLIFTGRKLPFGLITSLSLGILGILGAVAFIGLSANFQSFYGLLIAMAVMGMCLPVANIASNTIWQQYVPLDLQGRVMSVRIALSQSISPFALLLVGAMAEVIPLQIIILASGILGILGYLSFYKFTSIKDIEKAFEQIALQENGPAITAIAAD